MAAGSILAFPRAHISWVSLGSTDRAASQKQKDEKVDRGGSNLANANLLFLSALDLLPCTFSPLQV